ncbi:MAG: hypothetical protein LBQ03_02590 [Puniceicoccales bacterium]|jgi:hypothetical protein|nr:hypothetical protein [Puniceicoccales bacterium]
MKKISKLKSFFFLLYKNECLTIAGILATIAIGITCYNVNIWKTYGIIKEKNTKKQAEQNSWLSREKEINTRFRSIIDEILHRDKIDQPKLMALVGNAAKRLSLKYSVGMPESETGKFFSFNKISIDLRDVRFSDILQFDNIIEIPDSNLCIDNMELIMRGKSLSAKIGISALDIKADSDVDKIVAKILETHLLDEKLIKWNDRNNLLE